MSSDDDEDDGPPNADPPSPSLAGSQASSAPPPAAGQAVSAQQLSNHPLWAAARGENRNGPTTGTTGTTGTAAQGRGRGRGASRAPSDAGDAAPGARFERISMAELEARQLADGDGADSAIQSDDEQDDWARVRPEHATSNKRRKKPAKESDDDDDDDENDENDENENDGRRRKIAGLMGAAAFGGGNHYRAGASDAGSLPSEQSSALRRDAMREAFPCRGVSCVGCALANRIGPVNRFVRDNISQMTGDRWVGMHTLYFSLFTSLLTSTLLLTCQPVENGGSVLQARGGRACRARGRPCAQVGLEGGKQSQCLFVALFSQSLLLFRYACTTSCTPRATSWPGTRCVLLSYSCLHCAYTLYGACR